MSNIPESHQSLLTGQFGPVVAVTVTYGRRWDLLSRVLSALEQNCSFLSKIIIVDNGAQDDITQLTTLLGNEKIEVVNLGRNMGSAVGFHRGMRRALELNPAHLWLLDDDNVPDAHTLYRLILAHELLGSDRRRALVSFRPDRSEYAEMANNGIPAGERPNTFLNFHVLNAAQIFGRWQRKRTGGSLATASVRYPLLELSKAPYGGLLISAELVGEVGLPNEDLVLYADDHEYSHRIRSSGGHLYLVTNSLLSEIEQSWDRISRPGHHFFAPDSSPAKIYYSVRNRVFLAWRNNVNCRPCFLANSGIYLACVCAMSLPSFARKHGWRRLGLVVRAISDGIKGRLGMNVPL